jgi:cytosine/adenosine deaminase-related metal-dependent hydrolase
MTAPDWPALYIAERTARLAAEARLRAMHAVMWLALAGVLTIAALCGTLHAAEAASHAVARHNVNRQETNR